MNTEETFNVLDEKFDEFFKLLDDYTEAVGEIDAMPDGVMKESEKIVNDGITNAKADKIGAQIEQLITDMDCSDFAAAMDALAAEDPACADKLRCLLDECSQEAHEVANNNGDLSGVISKLEEMEKLLKG